MRIRYRLDGRDSLAYAARQNCFDVTALDFGDIEAIAAMFDVGMLSLFGDIPEGADDKPANGYRSPRGDR